MNYKSIYLEGPALAFCYVRVNMDFCYVWIKADAKLNSNFVSDSGGRRDLDSPEENMHGC